MFDELKELGRWKMAPQTGYLKEHEGVVPNSLGQLSSSPARLWSGYGQGCQSFFGDFGQVKASSTIQQLGSNGKEFTGTEQALQVAAHGFEKLNTAPFSIYPGNFLFLSFIFISMIIFRTSLDYMKNFHW